MENQPTVPLEKEEMPALDASMNEKIAYFDKHPEDIRPEDLNNLSLFLPGSDYVESMKKILDKKRAPNPRHTELWTSQTLREYVQTIEEAITEVPEVSQALTDIQSTREELQQKMAELQDRITALGQSLRDLGLPTDEWRVRFRKEVRPLLEEQSQLHTELGHYQSVSKALLPLYLVLRKKGYSHYDLIA